MLADQFWVLDEDLRLSERILAGGYALRLEHDLDALPRPVVPGRPRAGGEHLVAGEEHLVRLAERVASPPHPQVLQQAVNQRTNETFYLTTHSTHFIYSYMEGRKEGRKCFI